MFIPTLSLFKILSTSIGVIVSYQGYKKWKETKLLSMEYFYKAILWHSLDSATIMVMPLVFFDLKLVQALWNLNLFMGTIYYAYLIAFLLLFLGVERFHQIAKNLLIIIAPLNLAYGALSFKPAKMQTYPLPFGNLTGITWPPNLPLAASMLTGVGVMSLFIVFVPLLAQKIYSLEDPVKKQKGAYLILGIAGLFLAAIANWFIGPLMGYSFSKDLIQGLLCSSGQILFGLGMLLKKG